MALIIIYNYYLKDKDYYKKILLFGLIVSILFDIGFLIAYNSFSKGKGGQYWEKTRYFRTIGVIIDSVLIIYKAAFGFFIFKMK